MPSQKQFLIQQLQQKKSALKQLQEKCELQNKKIKLFKKENQDLNSVIEERQQVDTNLVLNSKELLTHNSRLENTIQQLKDQLEMAKHKHANLQKLNQTSSISQNLNPKATTIITSKKKPTKISLHDITVNDKTQQIDLPSAQVTDDDILQLQGFIGLKALILNDNLLGNNAMTMLCVSLVNLQKLNLANNKFTAEGLQYMKNLKNLKLLDIRNNNLTDQALKHISELKSLCELSCSKNSLTDSGASYLQKLSNLTYLDITNNHLTSLSAPHLSRLQKVSHLYLMSNKLSKDGIIEIIKSMNSLQFLDVRFNVWQGEEKDEIKRAKSDRLEVFC